MADGFLAEMTAQFWLVGAVFLRLGPAFFLAPGYGERYVSVRLRLSTAGLFSVAVAPVLAPYLPTSAPAGIELLVFLFKETTIGFFIGLMSRGMIYLLEMAGTVISQSISLAQMLGNATEPMPVISHLLTTTGIAILFSVSLADQMLYMFVLGYTLDMAAIAGLPGYLASRARSLLNEVFNQAVVLSSAFLALMFVYYLCIGFINKAMPQFMVSFIGIPFVALFSIHFLYLHHELLLDVWQQKSLMILMLPYGPDP